MYAFALSEAPLLIPINIRLLSKSNAV
jgi:hypothetical protein